MLARAKRRLVYLYMSLDVSVAHLLFDALLMNT